MVEPRTIDLPTADRHHVPLENEPRRPTRIYPNPRKRGEWYGARCYVHNYDTASGLVAAPIAGSDSRSEPRPIPEMPFLPTAPVRTQA